MTTTPKPGPVDFLFDDVGAAVGPAVKCEAIAIGLRVRTQAMNNPPTDWPLLSATTRRFGITGTIVSRHDGLKAPCFGVLHDDEYEVGYYHPEELEAVPATSRHAIGLFVQTDKGTKGFIVEDDGLHYGVLHYEGGPHRSDELRYGVLYAGAGPRSHHQHHEITVLGPSDP